MESEVIKILERIACALERNEIRLMNLHQAAQRLGVSDNTLKGMCERGEIEFIPMGRRRMFSDLLLREWELKGAHLNRQEKKAGFILNIKNIKPQNKRAWR